jgi:hypothetical protein
LFRNFAFHVYASHSAHTVRRFARTIVNSFVDPILHRRPRDASDFALPANGCFPKTFSWVRCTPKMRRNCAPCGQRMVQNTAKGCFKSHHVFSFRAHLSRATRSERSPLPSRGEPRAADGGAFSEGPAEDFGALGLRAAVEIRSRRPKPACRRQMPWRSSAGRGNST